MSNSSVLVNVSEQLPSLIPAKRKSGVIVHALISVLLKLPPDVSSGCVEKLSDIIRCDSTGDNITDI